MISLEEARTHVDGWLSVKLKTGKCSWLLRNELAERMRHRTISASAVYDEIGQMEGSDPPRRTGTKPADRLKYELNGLMHKHYKVSSKLSFMINISNHWAQRSSKTQQRKIETNFQRDGHAGKAAHRIVLDGYQARHAANEMTGEWIVYAEIAGVNYYLTLGTHEDRASVKDRVRSCFSEFPELGALLGWR
jgi:hypothetical protein